MSSAWSLAWGGSWSNSWGGLNVPALLVFGRREHLSEHQYPSSAVTTQHTIRQQLLDTKRVPADSLATRYADTEPMRAMQMSADRAANTSSGMRVQIHASRGHNIQRTGRR